MNGWRLMAVVAFGVMLGIVTVGCNKEGLPGLGRVTGTITMDGKPVPGALVAFEPVDGSAAPAMGRTDASGNYELYYSRGNKGAANKTSSTVTRADQPSRGAVKRSSSATRPAYATTTASNSMSHASSRETTRRMSRS